MGSVLYRLRSAERAEEGQLRWPNFRLRQTSYIRLKQRTATDAMGNGVTLDASSLPASARLRAMSGVLSSMSPA